MGDSDVPLLPLGDIYPPDISFISTHTSTGMFVRNFDIVVHCGTQQNKYLGM